MNLFNDMNKKNNKKILILGFNSVILNFLTSIFYFASKEK